MTIMGHLWCIVVTPIAHSNEKLHILRAYHVGMSCWHCAALGPQAWSPTPGIMPLS